MKKIILACLIAFTVADIAAPAADAATITVHVGSRHRRHRHPHRIWVPGHYVGHFWRRHWVPGHWVPA